MDDRDVELEALLAAERGPSAAPSPELEARLWARLDASVRALPLEPALPRARLPLGWLGAGVVAGLIAGTAVGWVLHEPPTPAPQVVFITTPAPAPFAAEAAPVTPLPVEPVPGPAPRKEARGGPLTQTLDRERVWLERAHTALQRSLAEDAWEALEGHRREFPAGALVEEREALSVQAQLQRGRPEEARAAALRFRARFPHSVLLPGVEAAVAP